MTLTYDDRKSLSDRHFPKFDGKWRKPNRTEAVVLRAQAGLGETTEADALYLLDIIKRQASLLHGVWKKLDSDDFRCPGEHWSRPLTDVEWRIWQCYREGSPWDYEAGQPLDIDPLEDLVFNDYEREVWSAVTKYKGSYQWPEFDKATWIRAGRCDGLINVTWEQETGEYGTVYSSWPVPEGPCAEALRLVDRWGCTDESFDDKHPVMIALAERAWLKGEIFKFFGHDGDGLIRELENDLYRAKGDLQDTRVAHARTLWAMPRESY